MYTLVAINIYIYTHTYVCVCVCVPVQYSVIILVPPVDQYFRSEKYLRNRHVEDVRGNGEGACAFLISAVDESEWSASRCGRFALLKNCRS